MTTTEKQRLTEDAKDRELHFPLVLPHFEEDVELLADVSRLDEPVVLLCCNALKILHFKR